MTGCVKQDSVRILGLEDVSISLGSTTAVNAVVSVENSSGKKIKVSDALFHITDPLGNEIATLTLANDITLPRKSTSSVEVPVRLKLANPLGGIALLRNFEENAARMLVTGSAKLKAGGLGKKYEVNKMPLSAFIPIFGGDVSLPENLQVM